MMKNRFLWLIFFDFVNFIMLLLSYFILPILYYGRYNANKGFLILCLQFVEVYIMGLFVLVPINIFISYRVHYFYWRTLILFLICVVIFLLMYRYKEYRLFIFIQLLINTILIIVLERKRKSFIQ